MHTLAHLRWHLALALGGALRIEWLHWQAAGILVAAVVADRVAATGWQRAHRFRRSPATAHRTAFHRGAMPPRRLRPRVPIELRRALAADCPVCRGFGCRTCAYTGLT